MDENKMVDVQAEQIDWEAKFKEFNMPEIKKLTFGMMQKMRAAKLDLNSIMAKVGLIVARMQQENQIPTEDDLTYLGKSQEAFEWILVNLYPELELDSIDYDVAIEFARKTWEATTGVTAALKN